MERGLTPDVDRLRRLLGDADLGWLVARIRRKLSRGKPLTGVVSRAGATEAERMAVRRLLGRPPRSGASLTVSLVAVDEVVRNSGACPDGLAAAVVALSGPIVNVVDAGAAREAAWQAALAPLAEAVADRPALHVWHERTLTTGVIRRLAGSHEEAVRLVGQLVAVLDELPAAGRRIGAFAADITGNAHALDDDQPLATLALGAARALADLPDGQGANWRREVWAAVGVLRDDLSTTVLALGLPGDDRSSTGRVLGLLREAGQPGVLTLRQLVSDPPMGQYAGLVVSVCENPVVVAHAADRLGRDSAALVCTSGQPSVAVSQLLRVLASRGATVRFHCDFDWGGVRIGNSLRNRLPAVPWRFDVAHYLAAQAKLSGRPLVGSPSIALWDTELTASMTEVGVVIEEELLLDELVADLARR